jgi:hypothetical protein
MLGLDRLKLALQGTGVSGGEEIRMLSKSMFNKELILQDRKTTMRSRARKWTNTGAQDTRHRETYLVRKSEPVRDTAGRDHGHRPA